MPLSRDDGPDEVPADASQDDLVFDLPPDSDPGPDPEDPSRPNVPGDDDESPFAAFDPTSDRPTTKTTLLDEEGNPLPEFDERYREDFEGLAFIGSLSKTFTWLGHSFLIRTLPVNAMMAVGAITKDFQETLAGGLAYRTALVSMAVVSVDGRDLPVPIGPEDDDVAWAWQRYNYARARWFPFTIDAIHEEYLSLEKKVAEVVEAMGKAHGPGGSTPG